MLAHDFWAKTLNDPAIFWAMATSVCTAALVYVAWKQLGALAQTSRADFIFRLKNNFFNQEARRLLFLVDEDLLQFEDTAIQYFTIRKVDDLNLRSRFDELGIKSSTISTYDIDDVLLGPLEDVGLFLTEGYITEKQAYETFYTYVASCAENEEIQKYVKSTRLKPNDSDIYGEFDDLYKRLQAYGRKARK